MTRILPFLLAALAASAAACTAAPEVPSTVDLARSDYERAFDAALAAAREDGLEPVVVDRVLGVIETDPRGAGSLLEPWRTDNAGVADATAHSINLERRRARFEFVPEPFAASIPEPSGPSAGPAVPGSDRAEGRFDLVRWQGPVQLRTWVMVDRQFKPNQRIGTWTVSSTTYAIDPQAKGDRRDETTKLPVEWTPIGRDVQYERRLTARIMQLLADTPRSGGSADPPQANASR